jgi:hypothetical protein
MVSTLLGFIILRQAIALPGLGANRGDSASGDDVGGAAVANRRECTADGVVRALGLRS